MSSGLSLNPEIGIPAGLNNVHPNGTGETSNGGAASFKLEDHAAKQGERKLRVGLVGIGFANITAAIRLEQRLGDRIDLQIFEKNFTVGGTWYENAYPGLCCDIPAHCYSLTFEPNHSWSQFYATGPEILLYLQNIAKKYKLDRFLRYGHRLTSAQWDDEKSEWHLKFDVLNEKGEKVGEKEEVYDVVIQGLGGLARWDWPEIEGLHDFKGKKLHSASYPDTAEAEKGKKVAVIGSGSSSIQIVPALQPHAAHVDNYVRGSAWIATPFASTELTKRNADASNYTFTEEEKKRFREDEEGYLEFRKNMERELNGVHGVTLKGSALQVGAVEAFKELMETKLASKPEIAKSLIPTFAVGCRRLTPGPGYLEALVQPNVGFVSTGIKKITETGIETVDGEVREYDTIVCATGFDTSYRPRIPIIGKNGNNVQDLWHDVPTHYLSMFIGPDHPNYFVINGPNSSLGSGSLLILFEKEVDYIVEVIGKLVTEQYKTVAVKQEAVDDWMEYCHEYFKGTVFSTPCRSWYKRGKETGEVVALWPGSVCSAMDVLAKPRWEDFDFKSASPHKNRFGWVGNGWSKVEVEGGDTAYYLDHIDYPPVPN